MHADKFTLPLIKWLIDEFGNITNQHFLLLDAENIVFPNKGSYYIIKHPLKKHFINNTFQIFKCFYKADQIIMHGNPLLFYFFIFGFWVKKLGWIIYGGVDMENADKPGLNNIINKRIRCQVLKRVLFHYTHIEGDSNWCNLTYHSNAKFVYSPVYLSNIPNLNNFLPVQNINNNEPINLLVGSSNDSSNNHIEIFGWLQKIRNNNLHIYCPLSYGGNEQYKENVKKAGYQFFGERFKPLEHFMKYEEYQTFLRKIHLAIFNHKRQEAMGVTLSLIGNGKVVYMCPNTTAFESLKSRGFVIFDNRLIQNKNEFYNLKNTEPNKEILEKYYSLTALKNSWNNIYYNLSS